MLSESDRKFNVKIISGGNEKNSDAYHEIINYFQKHVVKSAPIAKALNGLTLISNHDNFFRDYAHERFIRFDAHICEIGLEYKFLKTIPRP